MSLKPTSIPTKTLAASITALSSTFKLNNILGWDAAALEAADFGTQAYCVFRNANRSRIELMEFDPATVANTSITILRRGLQFDGDLTTEVTANKFAWTKGDTFVDMGTDAPQVFQWMKEYIDAASIAGAVPASTVASGIVEEATSAEYISKTGTGSTGARLFMSPESFPSVKTIIPLPQGNDGTVIDTLTMSTNTTAIVGQVVVPFYITVNKISVRSSSATTPGTFDFSLYSEDGQTQLFSVTTATVNASEIVTTAVPSTLLAPGIYYIMANTNSTTNVVMYVYSQQSTPFAATVDLLGAVTSEPVLRGTLTITAGTPPATIDPTAITDAVRSTLCFRLDN